MSALRTLGKMLGLVGDPQPDILTNAPAAQLALSRRNLLLAGGAITAQAAGKVCVPSSGLVHDFSGLLWDQDDLVQVATWQTSLLSDLVFLNKFSADLKKKLTHERSP